MRLLRTLEWTRAARGSNGERYSKSLILASIFATLIFVLIVLLLPVEKEVVVKVIPPIRTIVLPEPLPEPPAPAPHQAEKLTVEAVEPVAPEPELPHSPRDVRPTLDPNLGKEGRARAQEATKELAKSTASLDKALGDLSSSLKSSTGAYEPNRIHRTRDVRGGRGDGELATFDAGTASSGASTDMKAVEGSLVSVGSLSSASSKLDDPDPATGATKGNAGPGVYRTNASLLAVIQRYAAGIQYCYSNELKKNPELRGKLVVSITVAASGKVTEATILSNTVGSERLAGCALTQILNWKFPPVPDGVTSFQTPFVFTPPN